MRKVLHTSVTALVAVVKYGHQLDDNCLIFLYQSSHHLLLEPASTLVALIDSDSLLLHFCVPAFCLYKNFFSPVFTSAKEM